MRIISGEARGRTLYAPSGDQTRPTSDKIRGSLFNILNGCIEDAEVLDLFGGTGALALEALSRGAKCAVISDHSRENAELGGNALYAGSSAGKDGTLYLFCYENETGDRLDSYDDQDVVSYYMSAGASSVRTRIIAGRKFVCYRAHVLTEEGEQAWDTYETWDETLQVSFETQMDESVVLPILATIDFSTN